MVARLRLHRNAGPQPAQTAPRIVQPGAPGQPSTTITAREAALKHTAADTAFMQGMIGHHAQALEMVALLKTRTASQDMKLLGCGSKCRRTTRFA